MKASQYLFILTYDSYRTIIFSGATHDFLLLDKESFESVSLILKNPDKYKETHPRLIKILKNNGFIIENHINEGENMFLSREAFVNSKEYKTTIVPTFDCNYNCWYCIQKHIRETINPEKIELIIKHVKTYLIDNKIKSYILSWFGGEPLLEPDIIEYITQDLYEFCIDNNIEFSGAVTTNGALLTDETIDMLYRNHIDYYQITIDGDKEHHDKIKKQLGEISSFETILNNIIKLLERNERAQLTLRFNYTPESIKSTSLITDVNSILPSSIRNRISIDFHKIWQINESHISINDLASMMLDFHKAGYKICSEHVFSICYVDKIHHNTIFYNGGIDKCDNHDIDKLRGYLDSNGHIVWNEKPIINDVNPLADGNCCRECKYYPVCYGCCPVHREERILENGKLTCHYDGHFEIFEHRILDYCVRQMISNNIPI